MTAPTELPILQKPSTSYWASYCPLCEHCVKGWAELPSKHLCGRSFRARSITGRITTERCLREEGHSGPCARCNVPAAFGPSAAATLDSATKQAIMAHQRNYAKHPESVEIANREPS